MDTTPARRIAYIRTILEPERSRDETNTLVATYARQGSCVTPTNKTKHTFIFGSTTTSDAHVLEFFLSARLAQDSESLNFGHLKLSDLQLRMSKSRAATMAGLKVIDRCGANGIEAIISGADDSEWDKIMLQECDYIIDHWTTTDGGFTHSSWFWSAAHSGVPQDNMLTNPKYDVSKHDISKTRLLYRYSQYGWKASSGAFHGNFPDWRCSCGRKCKRGRCKYKPPPEPEAVPPWAKLPGKRSAEWGALSSQDACDRMRWQRAWFHVGRDEYQSVDTFSGE